MDFSFLKTPELEALSLAFRSQKLVIPVSAFSLQRYVCQEVAEQLAGQIEQLVKAGFNEGQLSILFDSLMAKSNGKTGAEIELVATGPDVSGVNLRDTSVVVRESFLEAKREVLVVGYAVYQGHQVFQALAQNMDQNPGLKVTFCLDVKRSYGDTTKSEEISYRFGQEFKAKQWPGKRLPAVFFNPRSLDSKKAEKSSLHAKCIVVDREQSFISSANFTEAAQERNIEFGVLVKEKNLSEVVANYFERLILEKNLIPLL